MQLTVPVSHGNTLPRARARALWNRAVSTSEPPPSPRGALSTAQAVAQPGDTRLESAPTAMRWSALLVALVIATAQHLGGTADIASGAALTVYALWRTFRPLHFPGRSWEAAAALLLEVAVAVAVVEATGSASSPYLVCLGVATAIAAFTGGWPVVPGLAVIGAAAVVVPDVLPAGVGGSGTPSLEVAAILVLVAVVAAVGRHMLDDARKVEVGLVRRVEYLSAANDILQDRHRSTDDRFPAMTIDPVARWGLDRLEQIFAPDTAAVILIDPSTTTWHVAAGRGVAHWEEHHGTDLPNPLIAAIGSRHPVEIENLTDGLGLWSTWGVYCRLEARGEVVGVMAVEARSRRSTTPAKLRHLADLAHATAQAADKAHWLGEIHARGAEEERARLARELHDHVGQSVAYLGFELDRLVEQNHGRAVQRDLLALREDMSELAGELRSALVDLRCDVSRSQGVAELLPVFLQTVQRRQRIATTFDADVRSRPALAVEREFWNVAREAVTNAERHADASNVAVAWFSDSRGTVLEVADDGIGLDGALEKESSYGVRGMRERALSVGATLDITSDPGQGTLVRMHKEMT